MSEPEQIPEDDMNDQINTDSESSDAEDHSVKNELKSTLFS